MGSKTQYIQIYDVYVFTYVCVERHVYTHVESQISVAHVLTHVCIERHVCTHVDSHTIYNLCVGCIDRHVYTHVKSQIRYNLMLRIYLHMCIHTDICIYAREITD